MVKQRSDRNRADSTNVSTSNCADSHVEEGVHYSCLENHISG